MDNELKRLIYDEYRFRMSDELFDRFAAIMTEVHLKNNEVLIDYGRIDTNVYIHRSGILRACYFDGKNEKTYGFSNPGTVIISYFSHAMRRPSFYKFSSCGPSVMMKVSKKDVNRLVDESHEFAKWLLAVQTSKLYFNEYKSATINGNAKERLLALMHSRPEIMAHVPLKVIASYLGITPTHLSRLKKDI